MVVDRVVAENCFLKQKLLFWAKIFNVLTSPNFITLLNLLKSSNFSFLHLRGNTGLGYSLC